MTGQARRRVSVRLVRTIVIGRTSVSVREQAQVWVRGRVQATLLREVYLRSALGNRFGSKLGLGEGEGLSVQGYR